MKVETKQINNIVVGNKSAQTAKFSIDENNFQHITRLLSKGLYSNPIRTLMIEYVQNALDTHANINQTKKVEVTLPSINYPFYKVQDFGEGMSPEFVLNKLTKYGSSTKSNTNSQVGGFGIGFKASTVYCDNFTMYVNYNGIKYIYDVTNCEGSGAITLLQQMGTTGCNGTIIEIPVNVDDITKFEDELQSGLYTKLHDSVVVYKDGKEIAFEDDRWSQYIVDDEVSYGCQEEWNYKNPPAIFLYSGNILITSLRTTWELCDKIMNIFDASSKLYFTEDEIATITKNKVIIERILRAHIDAHVHQYFNVNINVPIGKFEININRESFIYTDEFYMYILKKINDCVEYQLEYQNNLVSKFTPETSTTEIIDTYMSFTISRKVNRSLDNIILKRIYQAIKSRFATTTYEDWVTKCEDMTIACFRQYELKPFMYHYPKFETVCHSNWSGDMWGSGIDTIFVTSRNGTMNPNKLKKSIRDYMTNYNCSVNILRNVTGDDTTVLQPIYEVYKQLYPEKKFVVDIKFDKTAAKRIPAQKVDEDVKLYGILRAHDTCSTNQNYQVYNKKSDRILKLSELSKVIDDDTTLVIVPKDRTYYTYDDIIEEVNKTRPILASSILKHLYYRGIHSTLHMTNVLFVPEGWAKLKKINRIPLTLSEYVHNILNVEYKRDITTDEAKLIVGFWSASYYGVSANISGYYNDAAKEYNSLVKFMQLLNVSNNNIDMSYVHYVLFSYSYSFNKDIELVCNSAGITSKQMQQIQKLGNLQNCISIPYSPAAHLTNVIKKCISVIYDEVTSLS